MEELLVILKKAQKPKFATPNLAPLTAFGLNGPLGPDVARLVDLEPDLPTELSSLLLLTVELPAPARAANLRLVTLNLVRRLHPLPLTASGRIGLLGARAASTVDPELELPREL